MAAHDPSGVQMRWDVKIPLRDGIQLSAILYLPADHQTAAPALFAMTPYVAQTLHERAVYFAAHGFPFLAVDVRGRGNSQGTFHPLNDAADGYDVVEWLARQSCCNGKVGMWGGSYLGHCQWATAKERPPHLATIVPVAAPFRSVDAPLRGHIFGTFTMHWLTLVSGRTLQDRVAADREFWRGKFRQWLEAGAAFAQLDEFLGNPSALFQEWIAHPQPGEYWDRQNPSAQQYAQLSIPVLTITGAYDADQLGALEHFRQHVKHVPPANRARHYLIIGPWDHAGCDKPQAEFGGIKVGPASLLDLHLLQRQWYAWTMQGAPRPEFLKNNVAYYVIGAERWRYAESLEAVTPRSELFYLHSTSNPTDVFSSGSLTTSMPAGSPPDCYVYDPHDVSCAALESSVDPANLVDQRLTHAAIGKQLVYHSAPFDRDTEISGFFKLTVWLAIDQPDTDFRAAVYEVAIDGTVTQLTVDWLRARYRENAREATLIGTTQPLRYSFERFRFVSRRLSRGHRLRLIIGPVNSIHWQKNYNSGGCVSQESVHDARVVTVRLFHDEAHPSTLCVPFGHADAAEVDAEG